MMVHRAMGHLAASALLLVLAAGSWWPGSIARAQVPPANAPTPDVAVSPVSSTAAQRDAALERIRQERKALLADRKAQEAECYRKFAVEDCLRSVRASTRGAEALLRAQEIDIRDAERKEKAAERQRAIAEKLGGADGMAPGQAASGAVPRKTPADKAPTLTLRDADAARRAQEQRSKLLERSQAESAGAAGTAAREAKARAEYADKVRAAEERRKRVARTQAEEQAAGKKPAAPLPQSPASR